MGAGRLGTQGLLEWRLAELEGGGLDWGCDDQGHWFFAGLLGVFIGRQVVEADFGRRGDVLHASAGGEDHGLAVLPVWLEGIEVRHALDAVLEEGGLVELVGVDGVHGLRLLPDRRNVDGVLPEIGGQGVLRVEGFPDAGLIVPERNEWL